LFEPYFLEAKQIIENVIVVEWSVIRPIVGIYYKMKKASHWFELSLMPSTMNNEHYLLCKVP
jgi:hypothetical protein